MSRKINKSGVSLMIAYVMIISIAVTLSVIVFTWLKIEARGADEPIGCEPGVSILLDKYYVSPGPTETFNLSIKNNGRFTIDGVIVTVSDQEGSDPFIQLNNSYPTDSVKGIYNFSQRLTPGNYDNASFINNMGNGIPLSGGLQSIKMVKIQPFIYNEDERLLCQANTIITEKLCINC